MPTGLVATLLQDGPSLRCAASVDRYAPSASSTEHQKTRGSIFGSGVRWFPGGPIRTRVWDESGDSGMITRPADHRGLANPRAPAISKNEGPRQRGSKESARGMAPQRAGISLSDRGTHSILESGGPSSPRIGKGPASRRRYGASVVSRDEKVRAVPAAELHCGTGTLLVPVAGVLPSPTSTPPGRACASRDHDSPDRSRASKTNGQGCRRLMSPRWREFATHMSKRSQNAVEHGRVGEDVSGNALQITGQSVESAHSNCADWFADWSEAPDLRSGGAQGSLMHAHSFAIPFSQSNAGPGVRSSLGARSHESAVSSDPLHVNVFVNGHCDVGGWPVGQIDGKKAVSGVGETCGFPAQMSFGQVARTEHRTSAHPTPNIVAPTRSCLSTGRRESAQVVLEPSEGVVGSRPAQKQPHAGRTLAGARLGHGSAMGGGTVAT